MLTDPAAQAMLAASATHIPLFVALQLADHYQVNTWLNGFNGLCERREDEADAC